MKPIPALPQILIALSAFVFYLLFYNTAAGINVILLMAYTLLLYFFVLKKPGKKVIYLMIGGAVVSAATVVFAHTDYSIFIFWCYFIFLLGNLAYQEVTHFQYSGLQFLYSLKHLPLSLAEYIQNLPVNKKQTNYLTYLRFVLLPVLTIFVLFSLYSFASPQFEKSFNVVIDHINKFFLLLSMPKIAFYLLGVLVFGLAFVRVRSTRIISYDKNLNMKLVRKRRKISFVLPLRRLLLKKQHVAVLLFILLNLMLAWLNYLDISHIWFSFQWDGGYLKDMLHEGTYMLIAALIISIAISVYYLNSNIVFLKRSKLFNALLVLWLCQNMVMVVSVVMRNILYIDHFALAYLRIFVFFFLAACVVGLLSIIIMIRQKKSVGYLLSVNSVSVYIVILASACFNWDAIIARYNFAHYKDSFVHFNFLAGLNNSALPYMNYTQEQLDEIKAIQYDSFSFSSSSRYTNINFKEKIDKRKTNFRKEWDESSWLEWNYPDAKAYGLLYIGNQP